MKLFSYVVNRQIDVAVITYRLTRFGFEHLEFFFKHHGVRIEVKNLRMLTRNLLRI